MVECNALGPDRWQGGCSGGAAVRFLLARLLHGPVGWGAPGSTWLAHSHQLPRCWFRG